jgi:hypothetical protein
MKRAAVASVTAVAFVLVSARANAAKIEDPQGTPVTFTSTRTDTDIFIAHGDAPRDVYPDPFERVGAAPVTLKLAPGTYTVETASPSTSRGRERFIVGTSPLTLAVHPGDETVKIVGVVLEGLGLLGVGLGIVALVQFGPHDSGYDRFAVGLPILFGGIGSFAVGFGMNLLGTTRVIVPNASAQGVGMHVTVTF